MGILDIFKKKKEDKKEVKEKPAVKVESREEKKKIFPSIGRGSSLGGSPQRDPASGGKRRRAVVKKPLASAHQVLKFPHITEKATQLTGKNQYTFRVWQRANKTEVKKAVEGLYGIDVLDVKILNVPPKQRRLGKITGEKKGYKKAIVKLAEGQKIEVLPR